MRGDKKWEGFDYAQGCKVNRTRAEWRELIQQSSETKNVSSDLCLFTNGQMTHEIWDARRSNFE